MNTCFTFHQGTVPVLISMPHNGQKILTNIANRMTSIAQQVPDTDWYIDKLYDFAEALGVSVIKPTYSRYVIDLNRAPSGENLYPGANSTELCPTTSFMCHPLYQENEQPTEAEIQHRIETYWQPYHLKLQQTLNEMKQQYGIAVLLDAHSILSEVPRFFEGRLSDFNFGTADGISCSDQLIELVKTLELSPYSSVINGRFKGGYITRAYGDPENNIHAIQLELSQRTYMHEPSDRYHTANAIKVKKKLWMFVETLIHFSTQSSASK